MKAAIYCRVSTNAQERDGTSLDTQLEACLAKARDLGCQAPQSLVFTEVFSGLTRERPRLNALRQTIRDGQVDVLIAYALDRLSRDPVDFIIIQEELEKADVELVLVTEDVDSSDIGKLISHIRGYAAKLEAEKIAERTRRGKQKAIKDGTLPQGTGRGLYGYRWDSEKKVRVPIEFEARVMRRIFTLIAEGASTFAVATLLNGQGVPTKTGAKWHPLTVRRGVTNPAYCGTTYFGRTHGSRKTKLVAVPEHEWVELANATPAIVSRELYEAANEALKRRQEVRTLPEPRGYLLTGHLVCERCGSPVVGTCLNKRYRYYRCRATRPTASVPATCDARYVRAGPLEESVWARVREVLQDPDIILRELRRLAEAQSGEAGGAEYLDKEIAKVERRLKGYEAQRRRLVSLFRYEEDLLKRDDILDEMNALKVDRQADIDELARLQETKENLARLADAEVKVTEVCERVRQNLEGCTDQVKRLAFRALDIRVTVGPDRVDIRGVIPLDLTTGQSSPAITTIEQTSACLLTWTYSCAPGESRLTVGGVR